MLSMCILVSHNCVSPIIIVTSVWECQPGNFSCCDFIKVWWKREEGWDMVYKLCIWCHIESSYVYLDWYYRVAKRGRTLEIFEPIPFVLLKKLRQSDVVDCPLSCN